MISQKTLKLYVYVDGVNDVPFYGVSYDDFILANGDIFTTKDGFVFNVVHTNEQIEIGSFRYDTKRMGGAPTISFSLMYEECLDDLWSENIYAIFNGEKYFLKKTPTSSKSTEDARYKHDVELVSARVILDNVLFYDAVVGDPQGDDKPVSNSTKFVFFGKIDEFARRLNASLQYAKLQKVDENGEYESGYRVIVDDDITSEAMLVSFEDQYFSNAIQESYNTFKVPYYFVGEEIHFGNSNNVIAHEFSYGVDEALLSITKTNANNKVVNRITGKGSGENIPYYYPNNSAKGIIEAIPSSDFEVKILDYEKFADTISIDGIIRKSGVGYENALVTFNNESIFSGKTFSARMGVGGIKQYFDVSFISKDAGVFLLNFSSSVTKYLLEGKEKEDAIIGVVYSFTVYDETDKKWIQKSTQLLDAIDNLEVQVPHANHKYIISITCYYAAEGKYSGKGGQIVFDASYSFGSKSGWFYEDKVIELKDVGLMVEDDAIVGSTITQKLTKKISNSNVLLPPIYRNSDGVERFYNAINYPYPKPSNFDETLKKGYYGEDGILRNPYGEYDIEGYIHNDAYKKEDGTYIHFNNPYINGQPKEHIITLEDIKPTIKDAVNASGLRIDMFSEFAYDEDDNDETYIDEEGKTYFKHPYFFGKLRVLDFNLFECANENQPMTISFTSGDCGACNFEISVTEDYPQKNPVQVYDNGSLKYKDGRVWCGLEDVEGQEVDEYQPRQQDTSKYEVWIALKKEEDTYGTLMPSKDTRPKPCSSATANDGDTFVITGINLPQSYIEDAEQRLESEIIQYLKDNNDEKFNFSIKFSRIFFEENNGILNSLSENSSLKIWYDGIDYTLYVSSLSYNMREGEVLPEITVELTDSLSVSQNALQKAVGQVKSQFGHALGVMSEETKGMYKAALRKDIDDEAQGTITFNKGISFGEGSKVEIRDDNSAKLTIEYLEVTKKATFTSLEIQEKTHVGGQMLITPASINCGEVEEFDDYYRCYFQTKGGEGDEIFNQFAIGDQAICQTFNDWTSKYYWRLVVGIGEDYIDLSKKEGEYDEESDAPSAGDKIIQLGNRDNVDRQNAIVLSSHGDYSPCIIQYKGINTFALPEEKITTMLSPTKNKLTGEVTMTAGSKGLEMFEEWADIQNLIDSKVGIEDIEGYEYIKQALNEDTTTIGGLVLSSLISLGYTDANGTRHTMSGINGVYDATKVGGGIASWYGGEMSEDSAKTVLRFDGSGFFANKNITWDNEGGASFAGGKITITKEGALTFSDTISFGSGGDSVATVLEKLSTLLSYFTLEGNELSTDYQVRIKNNLIVEQDTSSGGEGEDTPAAGIYGIRVNGTLHEDDNGDGIIDLGIIEGGGTITGGLTINPSNGGSSFYMFNADDTYRLTHIWDGNTARLYNIKNDGSGYGILNLQGTIQISGYTAIHSGNYVSEIGDYYLKSTGGTISGLLTIDRDVPVIRFRNAEGVRLGSLGFSDVNSPIYATNGGTQYTLIHSGNIGEHALLKDGSNKMSAGVKFDAFNIDLNVGLNDGIRLIERSAANAPTNTTWWNTFSAVGGNGGIQITTFPTHEETILYARTMGNSADSWKPWKTIAFTNSDITGTAAKAKALVDSNGSSVAYVGSAALYVGDTIYKSYPTYIMGKQVALRYGASGAIGLWMNDSGNVTIGGSDLAGTSAKLYVNGVLYNKGDVRVPNGVAYQSYLANGTLVNLMYLSANDILTIGTTSSNNIALIGNVGIGTRNPAYKLDVNGTARVSGATTLSSTLEVGGIVTCNSHLSVRGSAHVYGNLEVGEKVTFANGMEVTGTSIFGYVEASDIFASRNIECTNLISSGDTSSGSDIRFKDIIENKTIKIEHIAKAPLFTFKWNDREDDTIHLGSSAQYWEAITPELVCGNDFKHLNYAGLGVAMGISLANKALNHEERIKILEKENMALKEEIRRIRYVE